MNGDVGEGYEEYKITSRFFLFYFYFNFFRFGKHLE